MDFILDSLKNQSVGRNCMGLFNKFKKESESEKNEPKIIDKTNENLGKIRDDIEIEIEEKESRLETLLEKIELSKLEYDELIGKIIQSKKELHSDTINTDKGTGDMNDAKNELKKIQDEISKSKEINEKLDQMNKKNERFFSDSERQKKKINDELNQRQNELDVLKKRLDTMKENDVKDKDDDSKVVEAASEIVATTNKRLEDTMKELDVVRQLLDKERRAHNVTKRKLNN